MDLNEWMSKFSDVRDWWDGKPTESALGIYPYFYIDLLVAWEKSSYVGAREVLNHLARLKKREIGYNVGHWWDLAYGEYPQNTSVIKITDRWRYHEGYTRGGVEGIFEVGGQLATMFEWHIHDGYGNEAGDVECWASFSENVYNKLVEA